MSIYLSIYVLIGLAFFFLVLSNQGYDSITEGVATLVILVFLWPLGLLVGLISGPNDSV